MLKPNCSRKLLIQVCSVALLNQMIQPLECLCAGGLDGNLGLYPIEDTAPITFRRAIIAMTVDIVDELRRRYVEYDEVPGSLLAFIELLWGGWFHSPKLETAPSPTPSLALH
jgi:hypothetical protein